MKKYKFKPKSYPQHEAQKVGDYFESKFPDGNINPTKIVDLARNKKSPIHKYFTWDDSKAAELYRRDEARNLIGCLYVEYDSVPTRAYESVLIEDQEPTYEPIEKIAETPDLQKQILLSAKRELIYWGLKYRRFSKYFSEVFEFIDTIDNDKETKNHVEEDEQADNRRTKPKQRARKDVENTTNRY